MGKIDKELREEAISQIDQLKVIAAMLDKNPDFAIMVTVAKVEVGLCDSEKFRELLAGEIEQAELCLDGKENKYE